MKVYALTLLLILAPALQANPFAKASEEHGVLILTPNKPLSKLFPVKLKAIDGEQVIQRKDAIWLKPGNHRLSLSPQIDYQVFGNGALLSSKLRNRNLPGDIEIEVQADTVYYLAFDASDADLDNWKTIVWKTENR